MERLFVYGSLQPGGANAHVLDGLDGEWQPAAAEGRLVERGWGATLGYPALVLDANASQVPGQLLSSTDLSAAWDELDRFEGSEYERVVASVALPSGERVEAHVYVLRA